MTIGRPFLCGGRCKEIRTKINNFAKVDYVSRSGVSGYDNTKPTTSSDMSPKNIRNMNKGLRNAYPEIRFDCPTEIANP